MSHEWMMRALTPFARPNNASNANNARSGRNPFFADRLRPVLVFRRFKTHNHKFGVVVLVWLAT